MSFIDFVHDLTINTLRDQSNIPCDPEMDFMFDKCVDQSVTDALFEEFGCVSPFTLAHHNSLSVCSFPDTGL